MRRSSLKRVLFGMALVTAGCLGAAPAGAAYKIDFFPLYDSTNQKVYTQPFGINNSGEIVGGVSVNGANKGFIADSKGKITTYLEAPNATQTWAEGINKDYVAGWSIIDQNVVPQNPAGYQGFFYNRTTGVYTTYDAPASAAPAGFSITGTTVDAINAKGDFSGHFFTDADELHHGYTVIGGVFKEVNASDPILGTIFSTDVDALTENNDISGHYKDGDLTRGFIYLTNGDGTRYNIPLPADVDELELERMNNLLQAVGYLSGPGYQNSAFYLDNPNGSPYLLFTPGRYFATYAEGINDDGTIVGYVYDPSQGGFFGYIATPGAVPEPSTFLLTGAGILGMGFLARRRSRNVK